MGQLSNRLSTTGGGSIKTTKGVLAHDLILANTSTHQLVSRYMCFIHLLEIAFNRFLQSNNDGFVNKFTLLLFINWTALNELGSSEEINQRYITCVDGLYFKLCFYCIHFPFLFPLPNKLSNLSVIWGEILIYQDYSQILILCFSLDLHSDLSYCISL